jgi:hypothetical protein
MSLTGLSFLFCSRGYHLPHLAFPLADPLAKSVVVLNTNACRSKGLFRAAEKARVSTQASKHTSEWASAARPGRFELPSLRCSTVLDAQDNPYPWPPGPVSAYTTACTGCGRLTHDTGQPRTTEVSYMRAMYCTCQAGGESSPDPLAPSISDMSLQPVKGRRRRRQQQQKQKPTWGPVLSVVHPAQCAP